MAENREALHQVLTNYFGADELKTLCFFLNVDYDVLGGEGKAGKARELISFMERRERIEELVAEVKQQRPNVAKVIEIEDRFIASIKPIQEQERELERLKIKARNRYWDEYHSYIESLDGETLFDVQRLNNLHYLHEFGLSVEDLKKNLARLGYYKGKIDDEHSHELVNAIVEFQVVNNMRHVDGIFGELTFQKMVERLKESKQQGHL